MNDEFGFLCALAGTNLSAERRARISNWNLSALDWRQFLVLAEQHGVLPLVAYNLIEPNREELGGDDGRNGLRKKLPAEIERTLCSSYDANLRRNLWFAGELARIVQHLERRQVRALPYKGPVLAQSVYGDLGLRRFSDLDLLISAVDFEPAKRALAEAGYNPAAHLAPAVERFWLRKGNECSFDGLAGKNLVELQWALLPYFYAVDLRVDDLMSRAGRTVMGGGWEVPCLSPEDSLLVLCVHAAKHLWTRLLWLSDIAETLRNPAIDYSLVRARAQTLGIARILGVSFWLVRKLLQADLKKGAQEIIALDPRTSAMGSEVAERLARGASYRLESSEYFRLILKLRERRSEQLRYLWRLFWTPGAGDMAAVQLPEALFPLYRIVRIGRLAGKLVG